VPLAKGKPHPNYRPPNVSVLPYRAQLIPVVDRGETSSPPELHKGALLKGQSPATVAELAIAYLRSMIAAAAKLTRRIWPLDAATTPAAGAFKAARLVVRKGRSLIAVRIGV
jgi:hypothetical protein